MMAFWNKVRAGKSAVEPKAFAPTIYPYYEISDLVQGTETWKAWRQRVIGASDAPVIMNENRWSSPQYLMEQKMGIRQSFGGNAATREGHRLEDAARRLLINKYEVQLAPSVIQDGKTPYLAASLDAINKSHTRVFEIKCGEKTYSLAASRKEIPIYYMAQLQHILMISQLEKIIYVSYRPYEPLVVIEVGRDEKYIERMRVAEEEFANRLTNSGHQLQSEFRGNQIKR
jgi:putative phage-type endonuclease